MHQRLCDSLFIGGTKVADVKRRRAAALMATLLLAMLAGAARAQAQITLDFESGDLTGWTNVPYAGGGTGDAFINGHQPVNDDHVIQGTWSINTWRQKNPDGYADAYTGILQSAPYMVVSTGSVSFTLSTSPYAFSGDPDSPNPNMNCVNLEREVSPGNWEMIYTASHAQNWDQEFVSWDTSAYVGSRVRIRIYDTHIGPWGHTSVDNFVLNGLAPPGVVWSDLNVSSLTLTSAVVQGSVFLSSGDVSADATVYWAVSNLGQVATGWLGTNVLGSIPTGVVQNVNIGGLSQNTTYYYGFFGSNTVSGETGWSPILSFRTPLPDEWTGAADDFWGNAANWASANVPDTGGESALFVDKGTGDVDLNGASYTLGPLTFNGGGYTLVDDNGVPGTLTVSNLTNNAGLNTINVGMAVGGPAEVTGGSTLTLARTDAFSAAALRLNAGTLVVQGDGTAINGFEETIFDGIIGDAQSDIELFRTAAQSLGASDAAGLLTTRLHYQDDAQVAARAAALGATGFNVENFAMLWVTDFTPDESGAWGFRLVGSIDDNTSWWIDSDGNGTFELGNRWYNRGCCGVSGDTYTPVLSAGITYKLGIVMNDTGGNGYFQDFEYKAPSGAWTDVDPSNVQQDGLWQVDNSGPVDLSSVPVNVPASSTIRALSGTNIADLGAATLSDGIILATASGSALGFASATIPGGAASVGFSPSADTYLTRSVGLDGSSATVAIAQTGPGRLILDQPGSNLDNATFDVQGGSLVAVHFNAFGASVLSLNGGELLLSSPGADYAYAKNISVVSGSTLRAGQGGSGVAGPLTVFQDGDIDFAGSETLITRATDGYTLHLRGEINGSGTNNLTEGNVIIEDTSFNAVTLNGGNLTVYSNLTLNALVQNSGTFTMAGSSKDLTVAERVILSGPLDLSGGPNLVLTGADVTLNNPANVTYDKDLGAGSVTIFGGAQLHLGTNALNVGTLSWWNGGILDLSGPINASVSMTFRPQRTIDNLLLGTGDVFIGDDPADGNNCGYVALTAANGYTGKTQIKRATLRADAGVGLPAASRIVFNSDTPARPAQWETSGSLNLNVGTNAGEVFWQDRGGFAARGSDLTVQLNGGAQIDWSAPNGFNNKESLLLNSGTADSKVELVNDIDLNSNSRYIQVINNRLREQGDNVEQWGLATNTDFARISGNISGNGVWNGSEFKLNNWDEDDARFSTRGSLLELTGTNTYSQRTVIRASLYALDGIGLPTSSTLMFQHTDASWYENVLLGNGLFERSLTSDNEIQGGVSWWYGSGGFAARGGPLTVGFPNAPDPLLWSSNNRGFNNQWLQLNSQYADSRMTITNKISFEGNTVNVSVWDNPGTDQDEAELSGVLSGSNSGAWFYKRGHGTVWLSGVNTFDQRIFVEWGAVRAVEGVGLPVGAGVYFQVRDNQPDRYNAVLESNGTLAKNISNSAGEIFWSWAGGFAAWGGPLTISLEGGQPLLWDSGDQGFNNQQLMLGSRTANNVTTFANTVDTRGGWRQIRLWDNPHSTADYAVITNLTSTGGGYNGHLQTYGDGTLRLNGTVDNMNYLRVEDNSTVLINGTFDGNIIDSNNGASFYSQRRGLNWGATPTLGGSGTITANVEVRLRGWSPTSYTILAPGDGAGTLTAIIPGGNGFVVENSNVTYEWELGLGTADKVAITGNLNLSAGWRLAMRSVGGNPLPSAEFDLFTYSGTCNYAAPTIDTNSLPADWVASGATVVHDTGGKRIYLTGIYSLQNVANAQPSELTSATPALNGTVWAQSDPLYVSVYWSTNDGGVSASSWLANGFVADLGSFNSVTGQTVSHVPAGLGANTLWYYTFHATNATGTINLWAAPSESFTTASTPAVNNTAGALTDVGSAALRGELTAGSFADVYVYWGRNDGGTSPAGWEHVELLPATPQGSFEALITVGHGFTYSYITRASNAFDDVWAPASTNFSMPQPLEIAVLPVTANLEAWYDSSTITGFSDGQTLTAWADSSSNGRDLVSYTGTPTYQTGLANGYPVMKMDNVDENLQMATPDNYLPLDVFVVFRASNGNALFGPDWGAPIGVKDADDNNRMWMLQGGEDRFWDGELPSAVTRNGIPVAPANNFDMAADMSELMILKVVLGAGSGTQPREVIIGNRTDAWSNSRFETAEVIAYSATNAPADEARIGAYLAQKYGIATPYPPLYASAAIANNSVSNLGTNYATLNGTLNGSGFSFDVYVYVGQTDGGSVAANWAATNFLGTFNSHNGSISYAASNLGLSTQHYYAFYASNNVESLWATPSESFETLGNVIADNGSATGVTETDATLEATLTSGGYGELRVYWGLSDGGTVHANWDNVENFGGVLLGAYTTNVSVLAGGPYFYRAYATNALSEDWANATATFQTPVPSVRLAAAPLAAAFSPTNISGCQLWLSADFGVTLSGDVPTQWNDRSGNGRHATQTGENNVHYYADAVNGLPAIQFRDNDAPQPGYGNMTIGSPFVGATEFIVFRSARYMYDPGNANHFGPGWGAPIGHHGSQHWMLEGNGNNRRFWNDGTRVPVSVSQNGVSLAQNNPDGNPYGLSNVDKYMVLKVVPHASNVINSGHYLGRNENYRDAWFDIAEVIAYDRELTVNEENALGSYLTAKYGIATAYAFQEKNGLAIVTATLSNPSVSNVTVNFSFAGDAVKDTDYTSSADSVVILAGTLSSNITLNAIDDAAQEDDETIDVSVVSLVNATLGSPSNTTTSITSDDPEIGNGSGATGLTENSVTLNGVLTRGDAAAATVYWGDNDGGTSYGAWGGSIALGTVSEGAGFWTNLTGLLANKTYYYRSYATNDSLLAEDWADSSVPFSTLIPSVSIADLAVVEGDVGTLDATFTVSISSLSAIPVSVTAATAGGSAASGVDFVASNTVVTIPVGQPSATFTVKIIGDTDFEFPNESFTVDLTAPTGCTIADAQSVCTIVDNDATSSGYLANFGNWMPITFDGYGGATTLSNWPALVRLSASIPAFDYVSFASETGGDLRFVSADGTQLRNFEIERWNTDGESVVWVQLPELPPGGTTIWAYWNNPSDTTLPIYATNGMTWADGYRSVWHLNELDAHDSSLRGHEGSAEGESALAPGMIGQGVEFDGNGDYIQVPASTDYGFNQDDFTMSAWVYPHEVGAARGIFGNWDQRFMLAIEGGTLRFHANNQVFWGSSINVSPNTWIYATVTRRGADWVYYVNGVQGDTRNNADWSIDNHGKPLNIGAGGENYRGWFDGIIDESRIEAERRSADWVMASYSNQVQGSTFSTPGSILGKPLITIADGATNIMLTSAYATAQVTSTGGVTTVVRLYWGTTDGGNVPGNWDNAQWVGQVDSVPEDLSVLLSPLTASTKYYYAFAASNSVGVTWASASFYSAGVPFINNGTGPGVGVGTATLNGNLLSDGEAATTVITYWGESDGGNNKASWGNASVNGVLGTGPFAMVRNDVYYGVQYYYRTYATNIYGESWAPAATNFVVLTPAIPLALPVTDNRTAHYDASVGVQLDGNNVTTWEDQSGFNRHATVSVGNEPLFESNQLNGLPTIQFNNQQLDVNFNVSEKEAWVVFKGDNPNGGGENFGPNWGSPWGQQNGRHWMMQENGKGFWGDGGWDQPPLAVTQNGNVMVPGAFNMTNINNFMIMKVHERVDDNTFMYIGRNGGWDNSYFDIAEIIVFGKTNALPQANLIGGYLAYKYGLDSSYPAWAPVQFDLATTPADNIADTAAQLHGTWSGTSAVFHVTAYWGESNGGSNAGAWANSALVGSFTNVLDAAISHNVAGLNPSTEYFFTLRAWNAAEEIWAPDVLNFLTTGPLAVNHSGGALSTTAGEATLNGRVLGEAADEVRIYWGATDGGTTPSSWDNSIVLSSVPVGTFSGVASNLLYGKTYYYRNFATNVNSGAWSAATTAFLSVRPETGSTLIIQDTYTAPNGTQLDGGGDWNETVGYQPDVYLPGPGLGWYAQASYDPNVQNNTLRTGADSGALLRLDSTNDYVRPDTLTLSVDLQPFQLNQQGGFHFGFSTSNASAAAASSGFRGLALRNDGRLGLYGNGVFGGELAGVSWVGTFTNTLFYTLSYTIHTLSGNISDISVSGSSADYSSLEAAGAGLFTPANTKYLHWRSRGGGGGDNGYYDNLNVIKPASIFDLGINNVAASSVTASAAVLNATLAASNAVYDVDVFWGPVDGGSNAGSWANTAAIGSFNNAALTNLSHLVTNLVSGTGYWFTFRAANAAETIWATPSLVILPLGKPVVDNGTGADVSVGSATLNGELLATNGSPTLVGMVYGDSDGGTSMSAWAHTNWVGVLGEGSFASTTGSDLLFGKVYYYRSFASNANGMAWAYTTESFVTLPPTVAGSGGSIGISFGDGSQGPLPGFPDGPVIVQDNWNRVDVTGAWNANGGSPPYGGVLCNGHGPNNTATPTEVATVDSEGTALGTAVTFHTYDPDNQFACNNNGAYAGYFAPVAVGAPLGTYNEQEFTYGTSGNAGTTPTVLTIANIPYSTYDIYIGAQNWHLGSIGGPVILPTGDAYTGLSGDLELWGEHGHPYDNTFKVSYIQIVNAAELAFTSGITNNLATYVTNNAATVTGTLQASNAVFDVYIHYGTNDAMPGAWANVQYVGSFSNVVSQSVVANLSGLSGLTTYYWTFEARNAATNLWAQPSKQLTTTSGLAGDIDGDGLPDAWEIAMFGNIGVSSGGLTDSDLDGATDSEEYTAGTIPTNDASFFGLEIVQSNGTIWVSFDGIQATGPGYDSLDRYYDLLCTTNLIDPNQWQWVPGYSNVLGQGFIFSYTNHVGPIKSYQGNVRLE